MATYQLVHWIVKRYPKTDRARVHLHGERNKVFGGKEKHIDIVELVMVPMESETDLVRCAVAVSANTWKMGFGANISKFGGKFYAKLESQLAEAVLRSSVVSSSSDR